MLFALMSALALAAMMTAADWLWVAASVRNSVTAGMTHGAVMCLCIGLAVGSRAGRRAPAAIASPVIGTLAASTFYLLTPALHWGAMVPAWMLLWLLFAALPRSPRRPGSIGTTFKRGLLA